MLNYSSVWVCEGNGLDINPAVATCWFWLAKLRHRFQYFSVPVRKMDSNQPQAEIHRSLQRLLAVEVNVCADTHRYIPPCGAGGDRHRGAASPCLPCLERKPPPSPRSRSPRFSPPLLPRQGPSGARAAPHTACAPQPRQALPEG